MYIIFVVESLDHLASCLFFVLASISLWTKAITLIIRRDEIINLIEIIEGEPCKPSDEEEINIQTTYDRAIRLVCPKVACASLWTLSITVNKSISESINVYGCLKLKRTYKLN